MVNRQTVLFGVSDKEDKTLLSSLCDKADKAIYSGRHIFSKFLTPREANMVTERFSQFSGVMLWGGFDDAERCVAVFYDNTSEYFPENDDFPIVAVKIEPNNKVTYSHRDYLGSLMNLGISRELLGDIVINESIATLFCLEEIADYITMNLSKVANTGVRVTLCPQSDLQLPQKQFKSFIKTVASPRLDCVVSACTNLARGKASALIDRGMVSVNYEVAKSQSVQIEGKTTLTVRGYGKFSVEQKNEMSKKGKYILNINQYI